MDDVLVMFSGGKDSFITACRLIMKGYRVRLISFNNGAVWGETNLLHGVKRLTNRFGEERIQYEGVYNTAGIVMSLTDSWSYLTQLQLGEKYPTLINAQLQCLHCQSAMWVSAIAYAVAKDIEMICTGYRSSDVFCTGHTEFINAMSEVAKSFGIEVNLPVWNTSEWDKLNGWERDNEMALFQFQPQVYEPKCLLGKPVKAMTKREKEDMMKFFDDNIKPVFVEEINHMIPVFRCMKLSSVSLIPLNYDVPDPNEGYY